MITGEHFQNAYVTRNLEKAVADFSKYAEVRAEYFWEGDVPVVTPQGEDSMHLKLALLWVGDLQYEFIQPVSGLEHIYIDALREDDRISFHHVCMRVDDWDELHRSLAEQPYPIVFEGAAGPSKFLYVDARPYCGHFLEYSMMPSEMWAETGGR